MLISARFSSGFQNRLWAEAVHTATKIGNILPSSRQPISPHKMFFGVESKIANFLQPFGRVAYITNRSNFHRKFSPKAKSVSSLATQRIMPLIPLDFISLRLIKFFYLVMFQSGLSGMEG